MAKKYQPYVPPVPKKYSEQEFEDKKRDILTMNHYDMASLQRFAPSGHPYFDTSLPFHEIFDKRFKELGGMTPEISKSLGWGR